MSGLLQKYAEEMRKNFSRGNAVSVRSIVSDTEKDPLARYKKALEDKESFEVVFDQTGEDDSLMCRDSHGLWIVYRFEDVSKDLSYYEELNKRHFVGTGFVVKVSEVDEANGIVYVRSAYHNSQSTKQKIIREILSELNRKDRKEDELLVLPGRIERVSEKRALVNLLGQGILGIIPTEQWQVGYVRHLPKTIKRGEVYDFVVLGQKNNTSARHRGLAFNLTRVPITEDPWESLKKTNPSLATGSLINVECVSKPAGKSYWWGKCSTIDGIEIMCDYSTSIARPYVGVLYKCRVKRYDPDNHKLQATAFEIIDTPRGSKEAINWINERPNKKPRRRPKTEG